MKKRMQAAAFFLILLAAGTGSTCAYLIADTQVKNEFSVSQVKTGITEEFEPPDNPRPGSVIKKAPRVHSDSDVNCYVRMRVGFTNDGASFCEDLSINPGWILKEDGCYYWSQVLPPGKDTAPLFNQVVLRQDIAGENLQSFDILVYSEAVQALEEGEAASWEAMDL